MLSPSLQNSIRVRLGLLILLLTGIALPAGGQSIYEIVPEESVIGFSAEHMGILTVDGAFRQIAGRIELRGERRDSVYVNVLVKTASVDTDNRLRDRSLRTDVFLDVERHPVIRYEGSGYFLTGRTVAAEGTVTLRGQEFGLKETTAEITTVQDSLYLTSEFMMRRSHANLSFDSSMDSLIGDEVRIMVDIVAVRSATTSASRIFGRDSTRHHSADVSSNSPQGRRPGTHFGSARMHVER